MIKGKIDIPLIQQKGFIRFIQQTIFNTMGRRLNHAHSHLLDITRLKITELFQASPEVQALFSGYLRYDLGIIPEEAESIATKVPDIIGRSLRIEYKIKIGTLSVKALLLNNYDEILSLPEAKFVQTYTSKEQVTIEWLKWMLTRGNEMIISDFHVHYVPSGTASSRSGGAIMIKQGSFRIPPEFAGTIEDNFISRSLQNINKFILDEIGKIVL